MHAHTVIVAVDDESIRELLCELVGRHGHVPYAAATVAGVRAALEDGASRACVVVIDANDALGVELLAMLRDADGRLGVPILALGDEPSLPVDVRRLLRPVSVKAVVDAIARTCVRGS